MTRDRFAAKGNQAGRDAKDPPRKGLLITPSDTVDLPFVCTGFQLEVAADLKVMYPDDSISTIPAEFLLAGYQYSGQFKRIYATTGASPAHSRVYIWGQE